MISPMRLNEDAIDLLEVNFLGLVPNRFQKSREAKIAETTQDAFRGANDQGQSFIGKSIVTQSCAIELIEDKGFCLIRVESRKDDGVSDPRFDVLMDRKTDIVEQIGLAEED